MNYRVFYTDSLMADIAAQVDYLRGRHTGEHVIETWFDDLFEEIDSLDHMPRRHPVDYSETRVRGYEIRKFAFRKYIVRYRIDEGRMAVHVLSLIHGARRR